MRRRSQIAALCAGIALAGSTLYPGTTRAQGGLVKVTPIGSHAGELCARDRAFLFEDPTGVRILYDPAS